MPEKNEALSKAHQRLAARFGKGDRVGGMRRKRKTVHRAATADDKRLQSTLKGLKMTNIPAVEEVNMFMEDDKIVHFKNPKVQANIAANTYVVSGNAETKEMHELLPDIITQLGPDNLQGLRKLAESFKDSKAETTGDDSDDDIPSGNFDEAGEQ